MNTTEDKGNNLIQLIDMFINNTSDERYKTAIKELYAEAKVIAMLNTILTCADDEDDTINI